MKAFRVKLSEGHSALPSQVVDGYLADNGVIQLYKGSEARDKAMKFCGIAEPYGKAFTIAPMQMAQLAYSEISSEIHSLLFEQIKFVSNSVGNNTFYFGNVFDEILNPQDGAEYAAISNEALIDLHVLSALCKNYIYIQIIDE